MSAAADIEPRIWSRVRELRTRGAVLSDDRLYRYALSRRVPGGQITLDMSGTVTHATPRKGACAFVLLNPSTASEDVDDQTVRKCMGFCQRWGFATLDIVNLFAWRATDPAVLKGIADPVGPLNNEWILAVARCADLVVLGWGNHGVLHGRGAAVMMLLQAAGVTLHCLGMGLTKKNMPRHPLYEPYNKPLETIPLRGVA